MNNTNEPQENKNISYTFRRPYHEDIAVIQYIHALHMHKYTYFIQIVPLIALTIL